MNHGDGTVLLRHSQDIEHPGIADIHHVIGREDLERGHPPREGAWQFIPQNGLGRVGDDQVPAIIDHGWGSAGTVSLQHRINGLPPVLRGKGNEAGISAESRRNRAAEIIIRPHQTGGAFLRDMGMGLDPAGQNEPVSRIDPPLAPGQTLGNGGDATVRNSDIGLTGFAADEDSAAMDNRIEPHVAPSAAEPA